jgi:hypothetical protein
MSKAVETEEKLRICKRCLLTDQNQSREKAVVYRYISELSNKEKVSEDLFQERLEICRSCKYLQAFTCQACGCFVEVRAAVKAQKCPYKKW